jgi:hypothetical protein
MGWPKYIARNTQLEREIRALRAYVQADLDGSTEGKVRALSRLHNLGLSLKPSRNLTSVVARHAIRIFNLTKSD